MSSRVQLAVAAKLQEEGRQLYKKGAFKAAISKFTEAVEMDTEITLRVLDNRAATYEKLGQLREALGDATLMIRREKAEVKGYLRAGKILLLMNDIDRALDIYKYGMRKVPSSHPDFKILEGQHAKILEMQLQNAKQAIRNRYDPVQVLPLELLEMIMKMVPFRALVASQLVSKSWHSIISSNHRFWSVLDLSAAKRPVKYSTVKSYLKKSKYGITRATLSRVANLDEDLISQIARKCKDLAYLRIVDGTISASLNGLPYLAANLTTLILNCETSLTAIRRLIRPECKIQHLECTHLASSTHPLSSPWTSNPCSSFRIMLLDLSVKGRAHASTRDGVFLQELLNVLPEIVEFQIVGVHIYSVSPPSTELDLTKNEKLETFVCRHSKIMMPNHFKFPPSLKNLDLQGTWQQTFYERTPVLEPDYLPNLASLNVRESNIQVEGLVAIVPPSSTNLLFKKLDISCARELDVFNSFQDLYLRPNCFPELAELGMELFHDVDNNFIKLFAVFPKLKKLNLSMTQVSGLGVLWLLNDYKGHIEELILNQCHSVGAEVVQMARERGVRVEQNLANSNVASVKKARVFAVYK